MAALITFCLMFLFLPLAKQLSAPDALTVVIHTIEQLIDFYQTDYRDLNVDGLFGLRVLEGHLSVIIQQHKAGNLGHLSPETVSRVISLTGKASNICEAAVKHVEKDNPEYFRMMKYVVGSPWTVFDEKRRRVDMINAWSPVTYKHAKRTIKMDENVSDMCMAELIGPHEASGMPCDISNKCVHTMTSPGLLGYDITHQLLWNMLAEKAGCKKQLLRKLTETKRGTMDTLREEFCTNNYIQMIQTLDKSTKTVIVPSLQDIFLEQLFVCPSLGYFEFLKLEYLPAITSWQLKSGCYGQMPHPKKGTFLNDVNLVGKFKDDYVNEGITDADPSKSVLRDILAGVKIGNPAPRDAPAFPGRTLLVYDGAEGIQMGRKLLMEKIMTGGCLAHKTAVASAALALYLRYLTEPDAAQLFNMSSHADLEHKTRLGGPSDLGKPAKILDTLMEKTDGNHGNEGIEAHHSDAIQELHANLMRNEADLNKAPETFKTVPAGIMSDGNVLGEQVNGIVRANDNRNLSEPNFAAVAANEQRTGATDNNMLADQMHIVNDGENGYKDNYQYDGGLHRVIGGKQLNNEDYHAQHHQLVRPLMKNVDENYNNGDDKPNEDEYAYEDEEDDDDEEEDEDEYDDADHDQQVVNYNQNDGYDDENNDNDMNVGHMAQGQGHLIVRNFARPGIRQYDNVNDNQEEKSLGLGPVKDYKYDDEEDEDDYEYDDDNDEMERRRKEEVKEDFIHTPITTVAWHHSGITAIQTSSAEAVSKTMVFFVVVLSFCSLLLLYRFVRKRRLRIRINSKYFHL